MRRVRAFLKAAHSPGGKLIVCLATLGLGLAADAWHVAVGHDVAIGSLGALIALLQDRRV